MYMFIEWGNDFFFFNRFVKFNLLRIDMENLIEVFELDRRKIRKLVDWLGGDVI